VAKREKNCPMVEIYLSHHTQYNRRVFRISIEGGGRYNITFDGPLYLITKIIKVMNDNKIAYFLKLKI